MEGARKPTPKERSTKTPRTSVKSKKPYPTCPYMLEADRNPDRTLNGALYRIPPILTNIPRILTGPYRSIYL